MEGRPAEIAPSEVAMASRVDRLVKLNEASRFREQLLTPTTFTAVLLLALLAAGAVITLAGARSPRWRPVLAVLALADLAILPASYVARGFPLEELGLGFYWAVVAGGGLATAVVATWIGRRRQSAHLALVLVLALVGGVLAVDVITGSHLSLNSAFGYSPTGNSRLYGISNYSFGQVASAVCLLAAFMVGPPPGSLRRWAALGLLGATLVVIGFPTWGADVGGVLAFTPALLVFAALVYQRRIQLRLVLAGGIAALLAVVGFGLLDLARVPHRSGPTSAGCSSASATRGWNRCCPSCSAS